jgi:hypothetical protein
MRCFEAWGRPACYLTLAALLLGPFLFALAKTAEVLVWVGSQAMTMTVSDSAAVYGALFTAGTLAWCVCACAGRAYHRKLGRSKKTVTRVCGVCLFFVQLGCLFLIFLLWAISLARGCEWMALTCSTTGGEALEAAGWEYSAHGWVGFDGEPQSKGAELAYFKHSRPLQSADVLKMRVEVGKAVLVGLCGEQYDPSKYLETINSTAVVSLFDGTAIIGSDMSLDGHGYLHPDRQTVHIPETPFDVALRSEAGSNVPQIQFNDDDVWHDFAPGRVALKAGPWFPHVVLWSTDVRLTDLLVRHHWPITSQR